MYFMAELEFELEKEVCIFRTTLGFLKKGGLWKEIIQRFILTFLEQKNSLILLPSQLLPKTDTLVSFPRKGWPILTRTGLVHITLCEINHPRAPSCCPLSQEPWESNKLLCQGFGWMFLDLQHPLWMGGWPWRHERRWSTRTNLHGQVSLLLPCLTCPSLIPYPWGMQNISF